MDKVSIDLTNCYGINKLQHTFDFAKRKVYAIYAPNGCMKTSLARTFMDIATGGEPKDRFYADRLTKWTITGDDDKPLGKDDIIVLQPYRVPLEQVSNAATLLVNSELRQLYEKAMAATDSAKDALLKALKKQSKCKNVESELSLAFTFAPDQLYTALEYVNTAIHTDISDTPYAELPYDIVFDPKVQEFLGEPDVKAALDEYVRRYNELIGTSIYFRRGTFEYYNGSTIAKSLEDQGFFKAKHFVTLDGKERKEIKSRAELEEIINNEKLKITSDETLRKHFEAIDSRITANQTIKQFRAYILSNEAVLSKLSNVNNFKQEVWKSYLKKQLSLYDDLIGKRREAQEKTRSILEQAKAENPHWEGVISTFNERFSVPFVLGISNRDAVVIGEAEPILTYKFKEPHGVPVAVERQPLIEALSQGEKKALYVLDILFDIQVRQSQNRETLFIVDDIADSFDYRNKYAIVQYLMDIAKDPKFKMLLLTHNFDFFRTVQGRFVGHDGSLMASRSQTEITLQMPDGVQNIFNNVWKKDFFKKRQPRIASISFMRNILEYTKGEDDADYKKLTSLLHWKPDTNLITQADLDGVFTRVFEGASGKWPNGNELVLDAIKAEAKECLSVPSGVNFAHKVVLSIAIRLAAEKFMTEQINDPGLVLKRSQTSQLLERFRSKFPSKTSEIRIIERVLLMTPENIHLNAFMYEPIIDMSDEHLTRLYSDVGTLK